MPISTTTTIFSGFTELDGLTVTNQFIESSFLYFQALDTTDDYEIDCHLQIEIGSSVKRIPLETIFLRTNSILLIPQEYRNCSFFQRLVMATDNVVEIEVNSVKCGCCNDEKLDLILNKLDQIISML